MNAIFKVIFNHSTHTFTVVSELAKGKVKASQNNHPLINSHSSKSTVEILNKLSITYSAIATVVLMTLVSVQASAAAPVPTVVCISSDSSNPATQTAGEAGAIACGDQSVASKKNDIAIGYKANATGGGGEMTSAMSIGAYSYTKGAQAVALGSRARAEVAQAVALGNDTRAIGVGSVSIGGDDSSEGASGTTYSSANYGDIKRYTPNGGSYHPTFSAGNGSTAIAVHAQALTDGSTAIGVGATAGDGTMGTKTTDPASNLNMAEWTKGASIEATAIGTLSAATGNRSTAIGARAKATGSLSSAIGDTAQAKGNNSSTIGSNAQAEGNSSSAVGHNALSKGESSAALGNNAKAEGTSSSAIGKNSIAKGVSSAALGESAQSEGAYSSAIGYKAQSKGESSAAWGNNAQAEGNYSSAIGYNALSKGMSSVALGNTAKAQAEGALAFGLNSTAQQMSDIAIGREASTKGNGSVQTGATAIGYQTKAEGAQALAIGPKAEALYSQSVAIGNDTSARALGAFVLGGDDTSSAGGIDDYANLVKDKGWIRGTGDTYRQSTASGIGAIVVGVHAQALSHGSTALGVGALAGDGGKSNTDITKFTNTENKNATAIGALANAQKENSTAIGYQAKAQANSSIALGDGAQALAEKAISVGTGNIVSGVASGAFGDPSIIAGTGSYSMGNDNAIGNTTTGAFIVGSNNQIGATATYDGNGKLQTTSGLKNTSLASNSVALGNKNYINTQNTYVLGSGINIKNDGTTLIGSTVANSVYLGSDSQATPGTTIGTKNTDKEGTEGTTTTAGDTGTVGNVVLNGITFGAFAGATANGVVTVGAAGSERRIQNVAAGEISATSTDAINGSQLYAVANTLGGQVANTYFHVRNGDALQTGDTTTNKGLITDTAGATGTNTLAAGIQANAKGNESVAVGYQASTSENALESLAFGVGAKAKNLSTTAIGARSEAIGTYSLAIGGGSQTGATPTVTKAEGNSSIALGYGSTTASGADWSQAIGDLAKVEEKATYSMALGTNATIKANASRSTAIGGYAMSSVIGGTAIGYGATVYSEGGVALGLESRATRNKESIGYDVLQSEDSTQNNATWKATGSAVSVGRSGATNASGQALPDITRQITNVAAGSSDTDAVNLAQLKAAGLKFAGNTDNTTIDKKLGETLTIKGGLDNAAEATDKNTRVDVENGNMIVKMAKTLTDLTSATFGTGDNLVKVDGTGLQFVDATGGKVADTPSITKDGIDAGNKQITNVASAGDINDANNANNAVNAGDVKTAINTLANNPLTFAGDVGNDITRKLGEKLTIKGGETNEDKLAKGNNVGVVADTTSNTLTVKLAKNINLGTDGSVTTGNSKLDTNGLTVTDSQGNATIIGKEGVAVADEEGNTAIYTAEGSGISDKNGNQNLSTATSNILTDGANTSELTATSLAVGGLKPITIDGNAGTIGGLTNTTFDPNKTYTGGQAATQEQLSQLNQGLTEKGFNITADNSGLANNQPVDNVKLGDTVKYTSADKNITTTVKDNEIDFGLAKSITLGDDNEAGALTVKGDDDTNGVVLNGQAGSITLNNGTQEATIGLADAPAYLDEGKATRLTIDKTQVATLKDGLRFQGNTGGTVNKQLNETLTIKGGLDDNAETTDKNTRVDVESGNMIVKMAKTLTDLTSAAFADADGNQTVIGAKDILIKDNAGNISGQSAVGFAAMDTNGNTTALDAQGVTISNGTTALVSDVNGIHFENVNATGTNTVNDKAPSITQNGIDLGGNKITNVKAGEADTDAVNVSQLNTATAAAKTQVTGTGAAVVTKSSQAGQPDIYNVYVAVAETMAQVDENGNKLVKANDGKYYKENEVDKTGKPIATATPVEPDDIRTVLVNPNGKTTTATTLSNVKGNLPGANGTSAPTTQAATPNNVDAIKNNAATVGDVLNAGWNLQGNGNAVDFVKAYDTVNFVNGAGSTVVTETNGTVSQIKINTGLQYVNDKDKTPVDGIGSNTVKLVGVNNSNPVKLTGIANGDISPDSTDAVNGSQLNALKDELNTLNTTVAGGWNLTANGTNSSAVTPGNTVDLSSANDNNIVITKAQNSNDVTFGLADNISVTQVTTTDAKGNTTVTNGSGITITPANNTSKNVSLTTSGLNNGGNVIKNVASGLEGRSLTDIKNEGSSSSRWNNAATVGDLASLETNITNITGQTNKLVGHDGSNTATITKEITNPDGTKQTVTTNNVAVDAQGNPVLKTYNVSGQTEYINNTVISAIQNMNEQGIKFFHTNDGSVTPQPQDQNSEDASASGKYSTAIGYKSSAKKDSALAIGNNSQANGENSIAIGTGNVVNAHGSAAIGDPNYIGATDGSQASVGSEKLGTYVIGNDNGTKQKPITTKNTFVLGNNVKETLDNSIILGDSSSAKEIHTTANKGGNYTYAGANDGNVAGIGSDVVGIVSVGTQTQTQIQTRQIQNVAAGVVSATSTDAINGSQLYYTNKAINNTQQALNKLGDKVDDNDRKSRGGIAGATAMANLPQAYLPGKSMVAIATGTHRGQNAIAIGASRISDNGKVVLKLSGSANSAGDKSAGVGIGYQW